MKTGTLFQSKLLTKGTVLTISAQARLVVTANNIDALFEEVMSREMQKENPKPWIDGDVARWFKNQIMPAITSQFDSTIYRFVNNTTNRSILDEAEKTSVKKIYTYTEAFKIVLQCVLSGEVEKRGTCIIAYFKVSGNEQLYRFIAWRREDGLLLVLVDKVRLDRKYDVGDGACFSD